MLNMFDLRERKAACLNVKPRSQSTRWTNARPGEKEILGIPALKSPLDINPSHRREMPNGREQADEDAWEERQIWFGNVEFNVSLNTAQ